MSCIVRPSRYRVRGRVRIIGLGFCVRVSVTGSVSYLNVNCSVHTLLLSAPAVHRQSSQFMFRVSVRVRDRQAY